MADIAVLGAGGWGMALAISANAGGNNVTIWSPFEEEAAELCKKRTNERLLPGIVLPGEIGITTDISCAEGAAITIIAVPSVAVRSVAHRLSECENHGIVVNVAKGLEKGTLLRLSQVIAEELPESCETVVLSGPSHAEEVARGIPTSLVAASRSQAAAEIVQSIMSGENLRIYTSDDVVGVELGGALKNIIAIAAGLCDGLGLGDNSKAALITRGLAEMTRLGLCMGAREYTFAGLAGLGDLVVTCTSRHSRNNRFGNKVGSGVPIQTALDEVGTVEGYYATEMAHLLCRKYKLQMPIVEECYAVLYGGKDIKEVPYDLMSRPNRSEH